MKRYARFFACFVLLNFSLAPFNLRAPGADVTPRQSTQGPQDILKYISSGWDVLTRSMTNCETVSDPKTGEKSVVYLPAGFAVPAAAQAMQKNCGVRMEHLPVTIETLGQLDGSKIRPPGILYLENPYVVPGGRFNEMYGWDSYFILLGLLREGKVDLARGMVENFFFEIEHYGGVLNANRTYYLTRSQPPFLTSMILAVREAEKAGAHDDRSWLAAAYTHAVKDYQLWIHEPHLAGDTGLSRYYDFGEGPVPEMADASQYYPGVIHYFFLHAQPDYLGRATERETLSSPVGPVFSVYLCEEQAGGVVAGQTGGSPPAKGCESVETIGLTRDFYKGDRAMRESGFDTSFRFEPFSAGTHHYAPVCLNSLLYKTEKDLERLSRELGRERESEDWEQQAAKRRDSINKYLWNAARGLFFDYDFTKQTQSSYEYVTTFYPLWAGLASPEQAASVLRSSRVFEQPGGLAMSAQETTGQWDYPYGWAPTNLIAVEGLRHYGYQADANRISEKFLTMVLENFRRDGTIREKYNVVTRSSETHVGAGYTANVIGFGWTNAAFLELLHALPKDSAARLGGDHLRN
jgi:alpha,alpha-trehalase